MSRLRPAGLGPIVGHVTHDAARIWIRASDPEEKGAEIARHRRTLGVVAICEKGKRFAQGRVHYFRLQREYDRTGTFTFGYEVGLGEEVPSAKLSPDTEYQVRVGTLTVDDPDPDGASIEDEILAARLPAAGVWIDELKKLPEEQALATFRSAPDPAAPPPAKFAFLLGSCRYPGLLWKAKQADKIFGPMRAEALGRGGRDPVRLALMVGDQIYADRANRRIDFGRADTFAEFQERYLTAFGSRNMRALLRSLPTYMILDDHEIEDNWHQDRIGTAEGRDIYNLAINAYMSYQWLHGPRNYGKHLFYDFACAGFPFFVLDTRTHRYLNREDDLSDNHLLGRPSLAPEDEPSQLDALLLCLHREQKARGNVPKFVVSPSVFAPNPLDAREGRKGSAVQKARWKQDSDSWPAFPETRRKLLQNIVLNGIQNVVFLSGDIHVSNVAEIRFSGSEAAERLKACSITSSAFYWPFPFSDGEPSGYVHDSRAKGQEDSFNLGGGVAMDYRAWNFTQEDNFCRIDVDRAAQRLVVVPYDDEGQQIRGGGFFGLGGKPLEAQLELAPW